MHVETPSQTPLSIPSGSTVQMNDGDELRLEAGDTAQLRISWVESPDGWIYSIRALADLSLLEGCVPNPILSGRAESTASAP